MKRWVATIMVMLIIIAGVIWEQVYVNHTFDRLSEKLETLMTSVAACAEDACNTVENITLVEDLTEYWLKKEQELCYLVKHTETFQISDTMLYAENFIKFGNKEEAMLALSKLDYLFSVHHYNLGVSIENII